MTKRELTGYRDLRFNNWIRNQLPDSCTGFSVSDLDFIVWNYKTRRVLMLETKTRESELRPFQDNMFSNIDSWIRRGVTANWTYHGFYLLQFTDTDFNDGLCFINEVRHGVTGQDNRVEVSQDQVVEFLSLEWTTSPIEAIASCA